MKLVLIILILFFINNCSFDNKTGIWNTNESLSSKKNSEFENFKKLTINQTLFDREIELKKNFSLELPSLANNKKWKDIYYSQSNNFTNFSYNDQKQLLFKSKKLTKHEIISNLLFDENNLILCDVAGNIIAFSTPSNNIITKFNFYKKKYKKFKKKLNLSIDQGIIYVTDNFGYIYALDYKKNKILWAKNKKIPFRSNLKIIENKIIAADENNNIYFFNKKNGDTIKFIPTEDTKIKNDFVNNFSINNEHIYFLNTYGSLSSLNNKNNEVRWVINLSQSLDLNPRNLFNGQPLISDENYLIVTSHDATYIINNENGNILYKFNIIAETKPLLTNNKLFLISSNKLLICIDIKEGEIIYSYRMNKQISEFLKIKEKDVSPKSLMIVNDKILVFLNNSYFLEYNIVGNLENIYRFPTRVKSNIIFINNSIFYLDSKNKLIIFD